MLSIIAKLNDFSMLTIHPTYIAFRGWGLYDLLINGSSHHMKKYILSATFAIVLLISPAFTQAAGLTTDQINAIISLLKSFGADSATVADVNTALTGGTPTPGGGQTFCYNFHRDLTIGSNNDDVSSLQTILNKEGVLAQSHDSPFDEDLAAAVVLFQAKYGIRQTGYVGALTRA